MSQGQGTAEEEKNIRFRPDRAAMTVEASFLVPWIVLLTTLLIVMTFHIHNRNWYRAGAIEAGLCGNARYTDDSGEAHARERAQERIRQQTMPGSEPAYTVSFSRTSCQVNFSGQTFPAFSALFPLQVSEKQGRVRPVPALRKARALKEFLEE